MSILPRLASRLQHTSRQSNSFTRPFFSHPAHFRSVRVPTPLSRRGYATTDVAGAPNPFQNAPRRISVATLILTLIPIATTCLGIWQLQRLQWKLDLIAHVEEALSLPPMRLPAQVNVERIPDFAWRKVRLEGRFEHEKEMPFVKEDGTKVIVNRGWIWDEFADRSTRNGETDAKVEVIGMLRAPVPKNYFTPVNVPEKGQWVFPDQEEMARHLGTQSVLVDEIFEGNAGDVNYRRNHGVPLGRPPSIELRNMHATYAATWFSIAFLSSVGLFRLVRKRPA
ncbi:hypothetical protein BT69DRAFT_1072455 [Atractiella rhizophila]|nr:hypothetical protein BT69DRAFT_1072455 [Atractiella rhizophila]